MSRKKEKIPSLPEYVPDDQVVYQGAVEISDLSPLNDIYINKEAMINDVYELLREFLSNVSELFLNQHKEQFYKIGREVLIDYDRDTFNYTMDEIYKIINAIALNKDSSELLVSDEEEEENEDSDIKNYYENQIDGIQGKITKLINKEYSNWIAQYKPTKLY